MGDNSFLKISGIKKSFGSGENRTEVLRGIDFEVAKGEFCVLLGPSGSGKSTLLNIIGGIDSPAKSHYGEIVTLKWGLANSNNWISAYLMSKLSPYDLVRLIQIGRAHV